MKVLIISSPYYDYQKSAGRAFERLGYEVWTETYEEPVHPFRGWLKWRHKFSRNKEKIKAQNRLDYDVHIRNVFEKICPELVFIFNGSILLNDTLDYFRKSSKVVIWMYDSVLQPGRENCRDHIDHADAVFCFEKKDVEYYESIGKKSTFLPMACDTSRYFPTNEGGVKDIDILFAGIIYTSKKRKAMLERLVKRYPDLNICIYGYYVPYFKQPIRWLFRRYRRQFKNKNLAPVEVNKLYGRTKIALNIHHEQSEWGANPRVYEASGAGAYQICDSNPYIKSLFPSGEIGLYENEEQMYKLIDEALVQDKSAQAALAREIVLKAETFENRIAMIIEQINGLRN